MKLLTGGKCSICGEAYDTKPSLFGLGGTMYLGKIVRTYAQGSVIPVTVVVSFQMNIFYYIKFKKLNFPIFCVVNSKS